MSEDSASDPRAASPGHDRRGTGELRVIVKFGNDDEFTERYDYADGLQNKFDGEYAALWERIRAICPTSRLIRLSPTDDLARMKERDQRARDNAKAAGREIPGRRTTFFVIEADEKFDTEAVIRELRASGIVDLAYVEFPPAPPPEAPVVPPGLCGDLSRYQSYLGRSPHGVDVRAVWKRGKAGAKGDGVDFVDIEEGWDFTHSDLPAIPLGPNLGYSDPAVGWHGLAVLGVVIARHNRSCVDGFAPAALPHMFSVNRTAGSPQNVAAALSCAIDHLQNPGVILLEAQAAPPGASAYTPSETEPAVKNHIRTATSLHHVVVEAGGNASAPGGTGADLDSFIAPGGTAVFGTGAPDSGAIIVAAAKKSGSGSHPDWTRRIDSAFGHRIDCFAWGSDITTLDSGGSRGPGTGAGARPGFGQTSGAAAIIAGVACVVLGCAKARGVSVDPYVLRDFLRQPTTGTRSKGGPADKIGVMPNLPRLLKALGLW